MNLPNIDCVGQNELSKRKSHSAKLHSELFYITKKDLDLIDIETLL